MESNLILGNDQVECGKHLIEVRDSHVSEGFEVLRERLHEDGYLCMRQLIPREDVLRARKRMLSFLEEKGALSEDSSFEYPRGKANGMMGNKDLTHHEDFLAAVESPSLFTFFRNLFEEEAITFDYKWARGVPPGVAGTGAHMDYVYMGRGSKRLHTTWVPMGDIPRNNGPMVLLDRSHSLESMEKIRRTYGKSDVDKDHTPGWFGKDYLELSRISGSKWIVGDYQAGDVILMGMHMMHGSLQNCTDYMRLTCDIRFQPASEPVDERWVGESPMGHYSRGETLSIEAARQQWGV